MAARKPVVRNARYGARELRRPLQGHPALGSCLAQAGQAPAVLNPVQPIAAPENLDCNLFDSDVAAPIMISKKDGRYRVPAVGDRLRSARALAVRRLRNDVICLAHGREEASDWLREHPVLANLRIGREPLRGIADLMVSRDDFDSQCRSNLQRRFSFVGSRRSELQNPRVKPYLEEHNRIVQLLHKQYSLFTSTYRKFVDIANNNLRGGDHSGHTVTLQRLQDTLSDLPRQVSMDDLLDTAYHGLVNSAVIHLNHWVMADLLSLTAALGCREHGAYTLTRRQIRTCLFVKGIGQDPSQHREKYGVHRRRLADRMAARFELR